jgi:hypothetical protein
MMFRIKSAVMLLAIVALWACVHTTAVGPVATPEEPRSKVVEKAKTQPALMHDTATPPISQSPQGMLAEGGAAQIQTALSTHGFMLKKTGLLDDETKEAILAFQKRENLAATGMPDQLTLKRLGLRPRDILNSGS